MEEWGRVVMVAIAYAMSGAMVAVLWRVGMLQRGRRYWWLARLVVAGFGYVTVNIAYPLDESNQAIRLVALIGTALAIGAAVWWLADREDAPDVAQVGAPMQSEIVYSWESDNDTAIDDGWIVQPVDTPVPVVMYDDGRRKDRGSEVSSADSTSNASGADQARNDVDPSTPRSASNRSGRGRRLSSAVVQG